MAVQVEIIVILFVRCKAIFHHAVGTQKFFGGGGVSAQIQKASAAADSFHYGKRIIMVLLQIPWPQLITGQP